MLVKQGVVKGREERNRILAEMTDDVAQLVLADNDDQALALSLDGLRSARRYEEFVALVDDMAGAGLLNRARRVGPLARGAAREPAARARPAAAAAVRAARLLEDVGLPAAARDRLPGQRRRPAVPRRLLPAPAARALRRALRGARAAARDRRDRAPSTTWSTAAASCCCRGSSRAPRTASARRSRPGSRSTARPQAQALRDALRRPGRPAAEEQAALVEIEDALEAAARERLEGKKKAERRQGAPRDRRPARRCERAAGGPA